MSVSQLQHTSSDPVFFAILEGNWNLIPPAFGRHKRSRKATGDAIVDAMLEIAAASKMRAAAIMRTEERFTISKCIRILDEMQGVDQAVYLFALDLFENPSAREIFISLKSERRLAWMQGKFRASTSSAA
ncbi:hypothetical protein AAHA92_00944 [Salvia divinorum]|uniref:Uncharacterized protein n=1 Tax=Salvia divinorum TaxID=28513 RepID=A0ABD1IPF0_SALDI